MDLHPCIALFFFLYLAQAVQAQEPVSAEQIFTHINQTVSSVRQGYFDSDFRFKPAFKTDTATNSARIYFFREISDSDSICQFVVILNGQLWKAYDGTFFYYYNHENQTILAKTVSEKGTVKKYLVSGIQDMLAFRPYIFGVEKQPFYLEKYKSALIDTLRNEAGIQLIATVFDSFPNSLQASSHEPAMAHLQEIFTISCPDLVVRQKQEWMFFTEMPQYLETHLSEIVPLPDSVNFDRIARLDSLLRAGYVLTNSLPPQPDTRPLVQVGDTLPPFVLQNLNGDSIRFWEAPERFVLFDFWYRNCGYCLKAMPRIEALNQKFNAGQLKIWGINPVDKNADELWQFLIRREVTYSSLLDPQKTVASTLGINAYPTVILVDARSREVLYVQPGYSPDLENSLSKVIEDNK